MRSSSEGVNVCTKPRRTIRPQMMPSIGADGSALLSDHFLALSAVGPRIRAAAAAYEGSKGKSTNNSPHFTNAAPATVIATSCP